MKSPEYVAGVTSIYRKYIDLYFKNKDEFYIEEKDLNNLRNLYTRGTMETGYYKRHNGRQMVTLSKGSYENSTSEYTEEIKYRYVDHEPKLAICGRANFSIGKPGKLEIYLTENDSGKNYSIKVETSLEVMAAQKRPMEEEDLRRQLMKTGNSDFVFEDLIIEMDDDLFIPNKELNELRRNGLEQFKEMMLKPYRRVYDNIQVALPKKAEVVECHGGQLSVSITTKEQFQATIQSNYFFNLKTIYIPYRLFDDLYNDYVKELRKCKECGVSLYLSFSPIVRKREKQGMFAFFDEKNSGELLGLIDGFLVNSLESLFFVKRLLEENKIQKDIQADYGLYTFNIEAGSFLQEMGVKYMTVPFEWSKHEMKAFSKQKPAYSMELIVYGYIPLMESANCIYKTMKMCKNQSMNKALVLKDRYKTNFHVMTDCIDCRNTILNSVPLSLHKEWENIKNFDNFNYRLRFTIENFEMTQQILEQFGMLVFDKISPSKINETGFTTGHFRKGVL